MKNLRKEFPILKHNTYLNTASSGLLYDGLLDYRQEHDLDFLIGGSMFRDNQQQFLNQVRTTIANTFDALPENTVLIPNFSIGLNTILTGIKEDQKVLLLDKDYPSINFAVTSKGFRTCYATIDENLEENIELAIRKYEPTIFAFSLVQYTNGIAIDLEFLKSLKNKYPEVLIIADGTQFCGTKAFAFKGSGIDVLGCSGYKWLLGGYGNGFMLFADKVLEQITPQDRKSAAKLSNYDPSYTNLQARFQPGHLDTLSFGSLQYSLQYLNKIGFDAIEAHLTKIASYTKEELSKRNLLEKPVQERNSHSTIFTIKGDSQFLKKLREQNIITSLRGRGIRISFHLYNTMEDIQKLLTYI